MEKALSGRPLSPWLGVALIIAACLPCAELGAKQVPGRRILCSPKHSALHFVEIVIAVTCLALFIGLTEKEQPYILGFDTIYEVYQISP